MRDNRRDLRMKKNEPPSVWGSLALMGQLGLVIVIHLVLGFFVGNYLDGLTNTKNVYLYLGLLLGLIVGIFGEYRFFSPYFKHYDRRTTLSPTIYWKRSS